MNYKVLIKSFININGWKQAQTFGHDSCAEKAFVRPAGPSQRLQSDRCASHLMSNIVKVKTIIPTERWRRYLEILITLYRIVRTNWTRRGWGGVKSASSHGLIDWYPS